jgi:hypothetical protein
MPTMLSKFTVEYTVYGRPGENVRVHRTDDPIEAEEFLMQLLTLGARIHAIKHEGVELSQHQFDRMMKIASERLASERLRLSLGIDAAEAKHRFGFAT